MQSKLFKIGMYWRIIYGLFRMLLGLTLLKLIDIPLVDLLHKFARKELLEEPPGLLFTVTSNFLQLHPISVTYFLATYLIFWGIIDVFLSIALLRDKLWAFPVSLWLIAFFIIYELQRLLYTHSLILLSVIFIDIIIFWIINREYKKVKPSN